MHDHIRSGLAFLRGRFLVAIDGVPDSPDFTIRTIDGKGCPIRVQDSVEGVALTLGRGCLIDVSDWDTETLVDLLQSVAEQGCTESIKESTTHIVRSEIRFADGSRLVWSRGLSRGSKKSVALYGPYSASSH